MSHPQQPKIVVNNYGTSKPLMALGNSIPDLPVRLFIDRKSLRISAAAMIVVMTLYPTLLLAQSVPAGVTRIVPDGRTATTVTANGSTSTVTTRTVSGQNAFNSYSKFEIGAGNTGNLVLP